MTIRIDQLRTAATRSIKAATNLTQARALGISTAFLCHSHRDASLARGLETILNEAGLKVYIDWNDPEMPAIPDRNTALKIKGKIVETDLFLFLATGNSVVSRWCPWEIGYADGKKAIDKIIVIPTTDGVTTYGNEYLDLYRRIDWSYLGKAGIWSPGKTIYNVPEVF